MADNSAIEWTDATWNPIVGCSILTPGCTNCYAMKMAARIQKMNRTGGSNSNYVNHYDGTTRSVNGNTVWTGKLAMAPDKLFLQPLSRKRPTTYFVNSMGDLFHEDCPDEWIDKVFAVMALSPQHTFQVLTKRAARMQQYLTGARAKMGAEVLGTYECVYNAMGDLGRQGLTELHPYRAAFPNGMPWPLPNVWLGVSAERQQEADERIPLLLKTPAAIRFVSVEPLLGPINLDDIVTKHDAYEDHRSALECDVAVEDDEEFGGAFLDWVIVGGESGPGARPMHPAWTRSLRDQCLAAGVPFFFKQWGEWAPGECTDKPCTRTERVATWFNDKWDFETLTPRVSQETHIDDEPDVYRFGKKDAGRKLDGEFHNAMPAVRV